MVLSGDTLVAQKEASDSTIEREIFRRWPGSIRPVTYFYVVPRPNDFHGSQPGRPCSFGPGGYHFYDYCPPSRPPNWDMTATYKQRSAVTRHGLRLNGRPLLCLPSGRVFWSRPYPHTIRISSSPVLYNPRTEQLLAGSPGDPMFVPNFPALKSSPSSGIVQPEGLVWEASFARELLPQEKGWSQ